MQGQDRDHQYEYAAELHGLGVRVGRVMRYCRVRVEDREALGLGLGLGLGLRVRVKDQGYK